MYFIDTHAHLYAEEFEADRSEMIQRSIQVGVNYMLLPNIDVNSINSLHLLHKMFPENCFPMMGLHPGSVDNNYIENLAIIKNHLFSDYKYIAVGEIGLDLYWDQSTINEQIIAFKTQCQWALELSLPIAIHTRAAHKETIQCLKELPQQPGGVFHCFGGTVEEAEEIIQLGYSLGIGGILTYKNSTLPTVLKQIPIQHLLIETDAPYLPPVPYRGKRNESSYIPIIAEKLADIYSIHLSEIAALTSENAEKVFNFKK